MQAGLSKTSLRQLAEAAGISNRMLLYYFEDKSDVLTAVLTRIASDLAEQLNVSLPEDIKLTPDSLFEKTAKLANNKPLRP